MYLYKVIEVHPFENFVPDKATHLILGTFPTHGRNWLFNGYYPGRSNFFWRMMSEIYKHPFQHRKGEEAAAERLALLSSKGIALSDTIYKVRRKVATSSKDTDLEVLEKMDMLGILRTHKSISTVLLGGKSGPVSAHHLFFEHLRENGIPYTLSDSKPVVVGEFKLDNRKIQTYTVYSPSGINIGRYAQTVQQYAAHLPK